MIEAFPFVELTEIIRNIALSVAGSVGAWVAWSGLNSWKKQNHWEEDRDLAKKILLETHTLTNAVARLRTDWTSHDERDSVSKNGDEKIDEELLHSVIHQRVLENRWQDVDEIRQRLHPLLLESEVLWGDAIWSIFLELDHKLINLRISFDRFFILSGSYEPLSREQFQELSDLSDYLFKNNRNEDEFRNEMEAIKKRMNEFLRKYLGRES